MNEKANSKKDVSLITLRENFPDLVTDIQGNPNLTIRKCSSAEASLAESLCFTSDEKQWNSASSGAAAAFVVPAKLKDKIQSQNRNIIYVKNPALAHARFAEFIQGRYPAHEVSASIHASAHVAKSATYGKNVKICAGAVVGEGVSIGDDVYIGANAVIEDFSSVGSRTHIWPLVFIGANTVIGDDCHIHPNATIGSEGYGFAQNEGFQSFRIPQLGNVVLHNRVEVGANTTIDRGTFGSTIIGEGTKLDNLIHIAHNVRIGKNCLLTSNFTIGGSCVIGDNVMAGGSVTVRDHVNICSDVRLAGGSGLNNDVVEPGDYGGHPLQPVREYLKTTMCLPHLPDFRKRLKELEDEVKRIKAP